MSSFKLTPANKIFYGLGDTACNFAWQTVMLFLAYFYTNVYGLNPAHMGTMFLAVRLLDAVTDPVMGFLIDKTETKHGKYRPYLLWMAIPFGIASILVFYTPDFGYTGKLIYAYCSYIFLTTMYTAVNVPYCAMANTITNNAEERTSLQSYRFALSTSAGIVVTLVALPLIDIIGQGDEKIGYLGAMSAMAILSVVFFFLCFANTEERFAPEKEENKTSIKEDMKLLFTKNSWKVLFAFNVILLTCVLMKGSAVMYYIKYAVGRPDLSQYFILAMTCSTIIGCFVANVVFGKRDKKKSIQLLAVIASALSLCLYFQGASNVALAFILMAAYTIIFAAITPILWSMISDISDEIKRDNNRSITGIVFSTNLFAIKAGMAIGGALVGWLLASANYDGSLNVQSPEAISEINNLFNLYPAVFCLILAGVLSFYKKKTAA